MKTVALRLVRAATFVWLGVAATAAPAKPGKVIWICIDALRAENLHFMGYERETSPYLDELASKSVVFRTALSPSNATIRSVPAYMTGMFPSELFHDPMKDHWLSSKFKMLAEGFKEIGYATYWITTNGNASRYGNQDQGIDHYFEVNSRTMVTATIDEVITTLEAVEQKPASPSFVYVHLNDVHDPYRPPIPFGRMFEKGKSYSGKNVREGFLLDDDGQRIFSNLPGNMQTGTITQEDIDFMVDLYDGCIRYVDNRLPRLLEALNYDDAKDMLIVSADHGDQFFEDGFCGHGRTLRSQDFHVPLIVRYSGFPAHWYNEPVSLLDIYPTLVGLCGIEAPQGLRGTSLMPALLGEKDSGVTPGAIGDPVDWAGRGVVLASGNYWYALNTEAFMLRPWVSTPYIEWLFDLSADPKCRTNVATERVGDLMQCNAHMRQLFERMQPFTSEIVQPRDGDDTYGPNLLEEVPENRTAFEHFGRPLAPVVETNMVSLQVERAKMALIAKTDPNYKMHLFEMAAGLDGAHLKIEFQRADSGLTTWTREFRKPRKITDVPLQLAVSTSAPETRIVVTVIGEGKAKIGWPSFRELVYDTIYPYKWPIQIAPPEAEGPTEGLDAAEQERLKALGYL